MGGLGRIYRVTGISRGDKHTAKGEELSTDLSLGDLKAFVVRGDNLALLR